LVDAFQVLRERAETFFENLTDKCRFLVVHRDGLFGMPILAGSSIESEERRRQIVASGTGRRGDCPYQAEAEPLDSNNGTGIRNWRKFLKKREMRISNIR